MTTTASTKRNAPTSAASQANVPQQTRPAQRNAPNAAAAAQG